MYLRKNAFQSERPPVYDITNAATGRGVPVNAVAATASIACGATNPTAGKVITVGGVTYTLRATVAADYEIKISDTEATQAGYIIDAINMQDAPGLGNNKAGGNYKVPAENPFCSAVVNADPAVIDLTARVKGVAGDIADDPSTDDASFTPTTFATSSTGVDGTLGHQWEIRLNTTSIYWCQDGNDITGINWAKYDLAV